MKPNPPSAAAMQEARRAAEPVRRYQPPAQPPRAVMLPEPTAAVPTTWEEKCGRLIYEGSAAFLCIKIPRC